MKVEGSVRAVFEQLEPLFVELQKDIDKELLSRLKPEWHYESRIKKLESFSLKTQSGHRFIPYQLVDDFLACEIVVRNLGELPDAEKIVDDLFVVKRRMPEDNSITVKRPTDFQMDDVRLYLNWRDNPSLPKKEGYSELLFEVQIKTYLQHAWSIATHDFSYKSDQVGWARDRLGAQWRALLEHTELSIEEAKKLAKSSVVDLSHSDYSQWQSIMDVLREHWKPEVLPKDLRRLAQTIDRLIRWAGLTPDALNELITQEEKKGKGAPESNLSPYAAILQGLLDCYGKQLFKGLARARWFQGKMLIPAEFAIPRDLDLRQVKGRIARLRN